MKKVVKKQYVRVRRRLIVAKPSSDGTGYLWTLAAALGEMLLRAEEMFGPRDTSYTLLGIDFTKDGPQVWTPGNCGHLIVHLDLNCLTDRYDAYHQLAHECIHLLAPTGKADANILEEGIAIYFARWYMHDIFGEGWWSGTINHPGYADALAKTEQLLALDPDIIKKLRTKQPVIARITAAEILEACPATPGELAVALAERFVR